MGDLLKLAVCLVMKRLYEKGLIPALGGNVSFREGDRIWITPSAKFKGSLEPSDLVELSLDGSVLRGGKPSKEWRMHLAVYRSRPEVRAVVHAHNPLTVGLCASTDPASSFTPFLTEVGRLAVLPPLPPGSEELAKAVKEASKGAEMIVLKGHGVVTLGRDLWEALHRAEALEMAALSALTTLLTRRSGV